MNKPSKLVPHWGIETCTGGCSQAALPTRGDLYLRKGRARPPTRVICNQGCLKIKLLLFLWLRSFYLLIWVCVGEFVYFETVSYIAHNGLKLCVAEAGLEILILLPQCLDCWDCIYTYHHPWLLRCLRKKLKSRKQKDGCATYTCNPTALRRWRQEDQKLKATSAV